MNSVAKHILILAVAIFVSWIVSTYVGELYINLFNESGGSFVNAVALAGIIPSYIFLISLGYTGFGVGKKYWWLGILLIPALAFVLYLDISRIWFYALAGVIGWGIGLGISKLLAKSR